MIAASIALLTAAPAAATGVDVSTLFECRLGPISNPDAATEEWTAQESLPLVLLFRRDPGNNFAGRDQSLHSVDATKLLPIEPSYSINWQWPARVGVAGSPAKAGFGSMIARMSTAKAPTFTTLKLDAAAKTARAAIVNVDRLGNADMTGAVVGTCQIERGDAAVTRYQEISK
jgi:hypothetical protein